MNRLTAAQWSNHHYHTYANVYPKRKEMEPDFQRIIDKLGQLEDILYAPDGTPRISLDELCELVQAKQDGRVVVLPCKVGDTVYKISYDCARGIRYNPFDEKGYSTAEICLKCNTFPCDLHKAVIPVTAESEEWIWKTKSAFGKTVFLTRAAAENALHKHCCDCIRFQVCGGEKVADDCKRYEPTDTCKFAGAAEAAKGEQE